ncbi:MAG: protein YgfX [Porticoccaceae bacterium]
MTSMESPLEITLNPSKTLIMAQCWLVIAVLLLSVFLPVLLWAKVLLLLITLLIATRWLSQWRGVTPEILIFRTLTDDCIIDGKLRCQFKSRQFVTRRLIIVYLVTESGKSLSRIIPRDALSQQHHRLLRRLLIQRGVGRGE